MDFCLNQDGRDDQDDQDRMGYARLNLNQSYFSSGEESNKDEKDGKDIAGKMPASQRPSS